MTITLSDGNS